MYIQSIQQTMRNYSFQKTLSLKNIALNEQYLQTAKTNDSFQSSISFNGITSKGVVTQRGLLMHITSLPESRSFCGQFGDLQTTKFINWLKKAKQTHWIMNPLNALEDNLCPYSSTGRFSRNKFIVNLNKLTGKEYGRILKRSELPDDVTVPEFTLDMLERQKNPRFKKAYERFKKLPETESIKKEYNNFVEEQDNLWLEDYANYDVLSRRFGAYWPNWDKKLQTAPEDAKAEGISLKDKILNVLGHKIDKNFKPTKVSGCPSKKAYPYTQVWGHALYNYDSPEFWEYHEASLKQLLRNADLRLDHFVGYVNRAAIPVEYKKADGTVLKGNDIFKPVKDGGMGEGFFDNSWIEDIYNKKNPKGENVFEVFIRVAKELGLKPEETYVLEDFGPLAKTKAYKDFRKKFGKNFISQHVPVGMDICDPKNRKHLNKNVAILTGNHDMPPLREFVDKLMDGNLNKRAKKKFETFCKKELNLTEEEMNSKDAVYENLLKWHYTNDVKQVQTTLQDALGIYFRPNIPGFWNGMMDKFLMKTTPEALLPYWSRVFPKDFLTRDNQSGINPGYKSLADKFIQMMKELYSTK